MIALRSFVGARENCRRFGVALPAGFDERLRRACDFARAHAGAPTARSRRSRTATPATTRELLDARRAAARARRPAARPPRRRELPRRRLLRPARAASRYLIFDCGPLGDGGHGHYDALSVEAWAGDRPLVLDPGRFTYAEGEPNLRHWFRGTAAHNTVTRRRRRPDAVRALALLAAERRGDASSAATRATASTSSRRGPLARSTRPSTGGA